jgi:hypothetical protein
MTTLPVLDTSHTGGDYNLIQIQRCSSFSQIQSPVSDSLILHNADTTLPSTAYLKSFRQAVSQVLVVTCADSVLNKKQSLSTYVQSKECEQQTLMLSLTPGGPSVCGLAWWARASFRKGLINWMY